MEQEVAEESSCPGATGVWSLKNLDTHKSEQRWKGTVVDRKKKRQS